MNVCRLLPLLATLLSASLQPASAQAVEPRLHGNIHEGARSALVGSTPAQIRSASDLGALPAGYPLHGITLVFRRSPAQQAELDQLLRDQQNPSSPEFHRWITPEAFGDRFGVAEADLATTERWLTTFGFQLTGRSRARDRISFSGTAAQVQAAFGTPLHRFQVDGESHIAPAVDLTLPDDLAAITTAVLHLSDFRPRPLAYPVPHPAFTSGATQQHFLTPPDLRTMYHFPSPTSAASDFGSGAGQTIAIVGQSYVDLSPGSIVRQFNQVSFYIPMSDVLVPNTGSEAFSPGDAAESEIDLEYASGIAPSANFLLVHVGSDPNYNVFDAVAFAIDQNIAPVISISYGVCETLVSPTESAQGNALFQQAALQGQTLIAASGDAGSTSCAPFNVSSRLSAAQQQALSASYPASSPYVTAVGGTQLAPGTFDANNTKFWQPVESASYDIFSTLLSYVPETAWNEGSPTRGISASGGGTSVLYPRPSWQAGIAGLPSGSTRVLPDIALQASGSNPGFLLCTDDPSFLGAEGLTVGQGCNFYLTSNPQYTLGGGTSFAAPVFAAMTAILNQSHQVLGQGNINPSLYRLAANSSTAASVFHDITTGSNACIAGAPRCGAAGQASFSAGPGYDQVTGLGSIDFLNLAAALPGHTPATQATNTSIQLFYPTLTPGQVDQLTIEVGTDIFTKEPTAPTGTIALTIDGVVADPALPLPKDIPSIFAIGTTYSYTAPATPGFHVITATYAGDKNHGPSSTSVPILVGNALATGNVALAAGNLTLPANGSGTTTVSITPSGGYNGRLLWTLALTGSSNNTGLNGCYSIPSVSISGPTSVNLALGIGTACSSTRPAARAQFRAISPLHSSTRPQPAPWRPAASTIAAGLLLFGLLPAARRRPLPLLSVVLLLSVSTFSLTGCGGGSSGHASNPSPTPTPAPQAVTYTFTLTGQDSVNTAIQSSTNFTISVQ